MNKQKIIIFSSIFIVILLIYQGVQYINKNIYPFWNANVFNISAEKPLTREKIKVYFGIGINTINRDNDSDLFDNMQKYTILYNGIQQQDMINDYGENDFLITYDDNYYLSFRHFKTYWRAQHTYNINIIKQDDIPFLQIEIEGYDPMKFTHRMIPIKAAGKYRCNKLKEEAEVIYNMVELVDK